MTRRDTVGAGYLASSLVPARFTARLGRQWPALGGLVMAFAHAFGAALAWLTVLPLAAAVAVQFLPRRRG